MQQATAAPGFSNRPDWTMRCARCICLYQCATLPDIRDFQVSVRPYPTSLASRSVSQPHPSRAWVSSLNTQRPRKAAMADDAPAVPINITVKDQNQGEVQFKLKPTTRMQKIFEAYCAKKGLALNTLKYVSSSKVPQHVFDYSRCAAGLSTTASASPRTILPTRWACVQLTVTH